jgi:hypothetical protein
MNIPRYDTHGLQESERFVDTANVQAPVAERPQQLAVVLYSNVLEYSRVLLPRRGNNRRDGTDAPPPTSVDASLVPPLALAPQALASWMMRVRSLHSGEAFVNVPSLLPSDACLHLDGGGCVGGCGASAAGAPLLCHAALGAEGTAVLLPF